ncbi:MAG: hypothetical protein ABIS47_14230 [Acidimicrobiales bacterium]
MAGFAAPAALVVLAAFVVLAGVAGPGPGGLTVLSGLSVLSGLAGVGVPTRPVVLLGGGGALEARFPAHPATSATASAAATTTTETGAGGFPGRCIPAMVDRPPACRQGGRRTGR